MFRCATVLAFVFCAMNGGGADRCAHADTELAQRSAEHRSAAATSDGLAPPDASTSPLPVAALGIEPETNPAAATANRPETVRLTPPRTEEELPRLRPKGAHAGSRSPTDLPSLVTVGGSLSIVLGLFFFAAWLLKRPARDSLGRLPRDVLEVLGCSQLAGRQQLQLIRLGRRLVLVWVSPTGVETISEVTQPAEVDHLLGLCHQSRGESSTANFHEIFDQFGRAPSIGELSAAQTAARRPKPGFSWKRFLFGGERHHA